MLTRDLMTTQVTTISPEATVKEASRVMLDKNVSALPVVDAQDQLVGILTHTDFGLRSRYHAVAENLYTLLGSSTTPRHLEEISERVGRKLVKEVMRHPVITVKEDTTLADLTSLMLRHRIHRVPVLRDDRVVGIVTRHDFLRLIAGTE